MTDETLSRCPKCRATIPPCDHFDWCPEHELEALRSLLRTALRGFDVDVETNADMGGYALVLHPGGCITARRSITERQAEAFRTACMGVRR